MSRPILMASGPSGVLAYLAAKSRMSLSALSAARVAVELSVDAARQLVRTIQAVLAEADQRGVLEDCPVVAVPARESSTA